MTRTEELPDCPSRSYGALSPRYLGLETSPQVTFHHIIGIELVLTTGGAHALPIAAGLLEWLDHNKDCQFTGWSGKGYGSLVDPGVDLEFDRFAIRISCCYEHLHVERVSGT